MFVHNYFQCSDRLPDPRGSLSLSVPSEAILRATREVKEKGEEVRLIQEVDLIYLFTYDRYSPSVRAKIGEYACHGYTLSIFCSIIQPFDGTNSIPVWSQMRTNSDGISSILTVACTSIKKDFKLQKISNILLLFDVFFLLTKSMHLRSEYAHCLFK